MVEFEKLLRSLDEAQAFKLPDGSSIKSLAELKDRLASLEDNYFSEHVNSQKNDFATWIEHCFGDEILAKRLTGITTKEGMVNEINTRLEQAKQTVQMNGGQQPTEKPEQSIEQVTPQPVETPVETPVEPAVEPQPEPVQPTPNEPQPEQPSSNDELDLDLDTDLDLDSGLEEDLTSVPTEKPVETPVEPAVEPQPEPVQSTPTQTPAEPQSEQSQPTEELEHMEEPGLDLDLDTGLDLDSGLDDELTETPSTTIVNNNVTNEVVLSEKVTPQPTDQTSDEQPQPESQPEAPAESPAIEEPGSQPGTEPNLEPLVTEESSLEPLVTEESSLEPEKEVKLEASTPDKPTTPTPEEYNPAAIQADEEISQSQQSQEDKESTPTPPEPEPTMDVVQAGADEGGSAEPSKVELTDDEQRILNADIKDLKPKEIFIKKKLERKIKESGGVTATKQKEETNTPSQVIQLGTEQKLNGLTSDEQRILNADIKELSPKEIFIKKKLERKIKESGINPQKTETNINEIKQTVVEKPQEEAIDLLNISDEEFHSLIGVNINDEFSAVVSTENIIKIQEKKRLKTGVPGFDDLIYNGGIVEGSSILVSGGPGSGKTTFSIQQLGWAAERGEKCLFISLEEKEDRLIEHMKGYGLNPEKYLKNGTLKIKKLDSFKLSRSVEALLAHAKGELMIDIDPIMDIIPDGFKPDRIVLDSLSSIAAAFGGQPEVYRIYVEQLFQIFESLGTTSFIITEIHGSEEMGHGGVEDFIADGVINFYNMKKGHKRQPAVEIMKMRGVKHLKQVVPFSFIPGKGIEIYPLEKVFYGDD